MKFIDMFIEASFCSKFQVAPLLFAFEGLSLQMNLGNMLIQMMLPHKLLLATIFLT